MPDSLPTPVKFSPARLLASIFAPPFRMLPLAVWIYFALSFLVHPESAILLGNLPDSDDYMYLDQIADWFHGQDWFDNIQYRLSPPDGVAIAFTRVSELPMAALAKLFGLWLPSAQANLLMAALWPVGLFAVLLVAFPWTASTYLKKDWARLTAILALFGSYLIYQFSPGHIDHHGLTALLMLTATGLAARMMAEPQSLKWPILAGLCQSFALVVALEVLPPLIIITGWLGLWAIARGEEARRASLTYGATFFTGCVASLAVTVRPQEWATLDPLVYSAVYVVFATAILLEFAGIAALARASSLWRWIGAVALAGALGAAFLLKFPAMITGPYGAMNPDLARLMFGSITEALPIARPSVTAFEVVLRVLWPGMALVAGLYMWARSRGTGPWLWGMLTTLLAVNLLLAVFYQIRFMVLAQLFSVIPLAAFLQESFTASSGAAPRVRLAAGLWLFFVAGPLPMVVLPGLVNKNLFTLDTLLFPVVTADYECDMRSLAHELSTAYGNRPRLLMNEMASGPELLYRTPHMVLGAPFHTNVTGNLDSGKFFSATDAAEAESIIRSRGAELAVICRKLVPKYAAGGASLAEKLEAGAVPAWLRPVHYEGEKDYLVFEVLPKSTL